MIYKPKGRRYYMAKFHWKGKVVVKSTRAADAKTARSIEGRLRSELARGNYGILDDRKLVPALAEFLTRDFLPFIRTKFREQPNTLGYYRQGAERLLRSDLAGMALDKLTDQQAQAYAARHELNSPSTVNRDLRCLRRALVLASEWGRIERAPKITMVRGERQRDRVLSDAEVERYLAACPEPWRSVATLMVSTGARPGELHGLRWEQVVLSAGTGMVQILRGKSKAARRILPLVSVARSVLEARHEQAGRPEAGWVFPSSSKTGHVVPSSMAHQHRAALAATGIPAFPVYTLRHTALTRLGTSGCDPYTLARISGHSSIVMTQRYCHPQADAVERAFKNMGAGTKLVTEGGDLEESPSGARRETPAGSEG